MDLTLATTGPSENQTTHVEYIGEQNPHGIQSNEKSLLRPIPMCYVHASERNNHPLIPNMSDHQGYMGTSHSPFKHQCGLAGGGHTIRMGSVVDLDGGRKAPESPPLGCC